MHRYAIYFTPEPSTPLWKFGCAVLGYDSEKGVDVAHPTSDQVSREEFANWSQTPRRYGFHATLKAPFRLVDGIDEKDLLDEVFQLARALRPIQLGRLKLDTLGKFVALVPVHAPIELSSLAAACVESCENLRAPLSAVDRERRLASGLTSRQAAYLERYGYPHVLDEFRFHMTLTGPLAPDAQELAFRTLRKLYDTVDDTVVLDALTVAQQVNNSKFTLVKRFELLG